jgi:hypothetical protein
MKLSFVKRGGRGGMRGGRVESEGGRVEGGGWRVKREGGGEEEPRQGYYFLTLKNR